MSTATGTTNTASSELTPEEARVLLASRQGLVSASIPVHVKARKVLSNVLNAERQGSEEFKNSTKKMVEKLKSAGYVSLTEQQMLMPDVDKEKLVYYKVAATAKMKPFALAQESGQLTVKTADVAVDKVTKIAADPQDANIRIVNYTTKTVPTPLAKFLPLKDADKKPGEKETRIRKDGDAWKVVE
jgi:hypothetical protein